MTKAIAVPTWRTRSVGSTKCGATGTREPAGHGARRRGVDRADQRVGMRRAHRGAIGLARQIEVVAVAAAAGDEARVFLAAYRLSDACVHDVESTKLGEWREAII